MSSLGSGAAVEVCLQARQPRGPSPLASSRVAMYSLRTASFSGGCVRRGAEQDQAVDGARLGDGGAAAATPPRLPPIAATVVAPVARRCCTRGQDVEVERSREDVALARSLGLAVAAEIDGQDAEPGRRQLARLLLPASLVESAPVRQHDAARARAVQVALDQPAVRGSSSTGFGDVDLRVRHHRHEHTTSRTGRRCQR